VRHPLFLPRRFRVQNAEAGDDPGVGVREKRKVDFVPVGEVLEDRLTVITDGGDRDSVLLESLFGILQLDELRFAEGSPIGGTEEKKNRSVRPLQCLNGLAMVKLVTRNEGRRFLSHRQSDRGRVCPVAW
jgi:hypothetical protein